MLNLIEKIINSLTIFLTVKGFEFSLDKSASTLKKGHDYLQGYNSFTMSLLKKNNNAAKHPFHLVEPSPLPILASLFIALNLTYFITTLHRPDLYVQEIRGFLLICLGMVAYT